MGRIIWIAGIAAFVAATAAWWRRNRRVGAGFVNRIVNPMLQRRHLAGGRRSEIGMLEHVGRRSGVRRLTLVHPERTVDGFRIIVPLGDESQWARNVLAAGHCRLQLHEAVYELDEPRLVKPSETPGIPRALQLLEDYLGFRSLVLRSFRWAPGTLEDEVRAGSLPEEQPAAPAPALEPVLAR